MEVLYRSWMVTVFTTEKGYSILEMLAVLFIIASLSLISLRKHSHLDLEAYYYLNDYLCTQAKAMLQRQPVSYENGVSFNEMGHVNLGRTISFDRHEVIVHLGNGYATIG